MYQNDLTINFEALTKELEKVYIKLAIYGSKCSLWQEALKDHLINEEEFSKAKAYYGKLWYRGRN